LLPLDDCLYEPTNDGFATSPPGEFFCQIWEKEPSKSK
jgi:hypothetical protein